jgi:hypothetical protein
MDFLILRLINNVDPLNYRIFLTEASASETTNRDYRRERAARRSNQLNSTTQA